MDFLIAFATMVLVAACVLLPFGLARRANGECRQFLSAWAEENGMTLLSCRLSWLPVVPVAEPVPHRVVYRLTTVDRRGLLRDGRASVAVKFLGGEPAAKGVEVRWVRVREIPRPVPPAPKPDGDPLWDRWIDCYEHP